jgi:NADH dehydrogenase
VELLDAVAHAMDRPVPLKFHVPLGVMKVIIPVMQRIPQFPITMDQLQMLIEENICDGSWKQVFRFEPRDFLTGIRAYLKR